MTQGEAALPSGLDTFRRRSSSFAGWLADRRVPRALRTPLYGAYCRITGADPSEAELELADYPSLGAFFVRRLKPGLRPLDPDSAALLSPCDGTLQALDRVEASSLLQAKGRSYAVGEFLGARGDAQALEGAPAWTIYLSPRDYHRVHCPLDARLADVRWLPGARRSVAPRVLEREERVLATNERAVLELETELGRFRLVMVGAQNVGRIRVLGVERGKPLPPGGIAFARGAELARFEMGSTVVLIAPTGRARPLEGLAPGQRLLMGRRIGLLLGTRSADL